MPTIGIPGTYPTNRMLTAVYAIRSTYLAPKIGYEIAHLELARIWVQIQVFRQPSKFRCGDIVSTFC